MRLSGVREACLQLLLGTTHHRLRQKCTKGYMHAVPSPAGPALVWHLVRRGLATTWAWRPLQRSPPYVSNEPALCRAAKSNRCEADLVRLVLLNPEREQPFTSCAPLDASVPPNRTEAIFTRAGRSTSSSTAVAAAGTSPPERARPPVPWDGRRSAKRVSRRGSLLPMGSEGGHRMSPQFVFLCRSSRTLSTRNGVVWPSEAGTRETETKRPQLA